MDQSAAGEEKFKTAEGFKPTFLSLCLNYLLSIEFVGSELQDFIDAFRVGECDKTETPDGKPHERGSDCASKVGKGKRKQGGPQRMAR